MPIATPIDKFISNHARILLEQIKDMKIDSWKCLKTHDTKVSFDDDPSLLKLFLHHV